MEKKIKKSKNNLRLALWAAIFFILFSAAAADFIFLEVYKNKIYPGVKIGNLDLSGKTKQETIDLLNGFAQKFNQEGIVFSGQNNLNKIKRVTISPIIISPQDPDLTREILVFNIASTTDNIYLAGRSGNFFEQQKEIFNNLINKKENKIIYRLDEKELMSILNENFKNFEDPPQNAYLVKENDEFKVMSGKDGFTFNYQKAIEDFKNNIEKLSYQPVNLSFSADKAEITQADGEKILNQAYQASVLSPIKINYLSKSWQIDSIDSYLDLKLNKNSEAAIGLNQEKIYEYLKNLAKEIEIKSQDAELTMENGKVMSFIPSQTGLKMDLEKNFNKIEEELFNYGNQNIELVVEEEKPKIFISDINNLGIKELIGTGISNFKGSPKNRRANIKVGAEKLNGILIKPQEKFSLVKALGEISAKTGFLPELVIKGDRTLPEYGGGLCQIGTTAFRAALDAGLPILERQSHSYRVVYYEPAGTDATIYNPRPDLSFENDTPANILFLTRIDGDNLIFEFWGTSDDRKVEMTTPRIFNIKSPGAPRYIETTELKPGEKKLLETAHAGADAEFTRTITYISGEIKEEVWKSHYRPWQTVYLIGKTATSTPESTIQN